MSAKRVTATEFKSKFGAYSAQVHKGPFVITSHDRPLFVAMDIEEYERLKAADTRKHYHPAELPEAAMAALEAGDLGPRDEHLDDLSG